MGNKVKQNKNGKRKIDNSLTNQPVSIYVAPRGPITIPQIDIGFEEDAVKRAKHVYNNYEQAKDSNIGSVSAGIRKALRYMKDNVWDAIPAGVSNCTLSATQWVDPTNPIGSAKSIVVNPEVYGYNRIKENEAVPGNLVIAKVPNQDSFHTMMITGFTDKDGEYDFNGKKFQYKKGEPLVTYSRGGSDDSFIRQNVPLSVYTANSDGHTLNQYYRYNYPNEVFLPEITVEKALGGEITKSKDKYGHTYKEGNTIKTYPSVNWHNYRLDEQGRGTAADGTKTVIPAIDEDQLIVTPHGNIVDYRGLQVPSQYDMQEHPSNDQGYQLQTSDLFNAMTLGGLHNLSPTQWARRAWDLGETAFGDKTFAEYINDWTFGNNGIVSNKFAREHPYLSAGINMVGDAATLGGKAWMNSRPTTLSVTHRSPKEFDINNFYTGTSKDIGLHVGDAGDTMGDFVYQMNIPKPKVTTIDIGRNNIRHLIDDFVFPKGAYLDANPDERLLFLKEMLRNSDNRMKTSFPKFTKMKDGSWRKVFEKDFHFNLRDRLTRNLSKTEREQFDKDADRLLDLYSNADRYDNYTKQLFNQEAANLLHKYGIDVVKYNNIIASEGLKPSYFLTSPDAMIGPRLIAAPGKDIIQSELQNNIDFPYPLIIPQGTYNRALGGTLSGNSDSTILADNNNYIQDFKGNKYGLPTVRYDKGGLLVQQANMFRKGGTTTGPEVVITPDEEYNRFLNTLPDNQRLTPNEDYDTYLYWKLNGKPKDFQEALDRGMYIWDDSDHSYHGNSIAWGDDGTGYFIKPKHHDTLKYELDWFNKNIITEPGGHQRFETPEERAESDRFRENYVLADDPDRPDFYIYKPKDQAEGLNTYKRQNDISIKEKALGGHLFSLGGDDESYRIGRYAYNMHDVPGTTLPEVTVSGYAPIILDTYFPVASQEYPVTGHSMLAVPRNNLYSSNRTDSQISKLPQQVQENLNHFTGYDFIDKSSDSPTYNLLTNNCADATLGALNAIFGTNESPFLFTTPGDVLDYSKKIAKKFGGKSYTPEYGIVRTIIPRNKDNYKSTARNFYKYAQNHETDGFEQGGYRRYYEENPSVQEYNWDKLIHGYY